MPLRAQEPTTCNRNSGVPEKFNDWPRIRSPGLSLCPIKALLCSLPYYVLNTCSDPTTSSLSSQVFTQEVRTLLAFGLTVRCSQSAGNLEQWVKTGRQLAKTSVTFLSWGGECQGTSRFALWLGEAGKPEELTRPHSRSTPLKGPEFRSLSHFELSVLTDSLL